MLELLLKKPFLHRFKLIEFVVGITIVITAFSLVIPLLYNGIQEAKQAKCSSNLKSIRTWMLVYCESTGGDLPAYEDGWVQQVGSMAISVNQKNKPKEEFSCPSQSFKSLKKDISPGDYWRGTHYGINQHIASKLKDKYNEYYPEWSQANVFKVADPGIKVLFADASGSNYFGLDDLDPTIAGISKEGSTYAEALPPNPAIPLPYLRHQNGTGNFIFIDGHVELKKSFPSFMYGPGTSGYYFWNGEHQFNKPEIKTESH